MQKQRRSLMEGNGMKECKFCYQQNIPDDEVTCPNCGARLDEQLAVTKKSEKLEKSTTREIEKTNSKKNLYLTERITGKRILILKNGYIGRNSFGKELLHKDAYVSSHQCIAEFKDSEWYVTHIGKNPSKLNGMPLERDVPTIIRDGDKLELADLLFSVEIKQQQRRESKPEIQRENEYGESLKKMEEDVVKEKPSKEKKGKYFVVCRHCHTRYDFTDKKARPLECTICNDPMDKKDLAHTKIQSE